MRQSNPESEIELSKPEQPGQVPVNSSSPRASAAGVSPSFSKRAIAPTAPPKGRSALNKFLWVLAFVSTATVSATLGAALTILMPERGDRDSQSDLRQRVGTVLANSFGYRVTRPVNILVMGVDHFVDAPEDAEDIVLGGRSDVMLLVRVDPATTTASILSIPRDTRVEIPGYGVAKINHANQEGGAALAAQTVSYNLDGVPIDRYVRVSTDSFRALVDLLGGIEVYVPFRMEYEDVTQKLKIDLEEGHQWLNGDQAEQFARYRNDGQGDIGRVQRQQQLLRALKDRLASPATVTKLPQIIALMQEYVDTNLTLEEMLALGNFALTMERSDLRMVMLPGRFSRPDESIASYWILNRRERDRIMRDYFQVPGMDVQLARSADPSSLRIAVQNASGDGRATLRLVRYLREQGFYNVYVIPDWSVWEGETQVIAQRGDLEGAAIVQRSLGVGEVVSASIGDLESDLTIRIGTDWVERAASSQEHVVN
ncbi:LCP family protein [Thermoleptolyngbya sp. PKUAC-SCTB121]|uniref:LCP family protein n=1 Tax=Thermoleptolyngbya sp. PKUAC-SCTB121 TaxID=2811482 RepID=UPI001CEDCEF1|nr:LCP family protein [Thermoleptolyngbya sp. PKUAC-SCTB121]